MIDNDILVMYVAASSFPDGVRAAHERLHSLITVTPDRKYYGLSRPEDGTIAYKAAINVTHPGEEEELGLDTLVIKKGKYLSTTVHGYMQNIPAIGQAFTQLIAQPGIDPQGYCVEWYLSNEDVQCMVRLADQ